MTMNDHDWKNQELNRLLLKKWGLLNEKKKPDFLDLDKDGDTEESMESAAEGAEGLEEDCPPAELPAQGIDVAEPESETLTAADIEDLQNLLDKLANTLVAEPGMELAGGEAPSEEESPIVMRQEEELREIVRGVITRLREKKIVR